jgi:hypothetical protein
MENFNVLNCENWRYQKFQITKQDDSYLISGETWKKTNNSDIFLELTHCKKRIQIYSKNARHCLAKGEIRVKEENI